MMRAAGPAVIAALLCAAASGPATAQELTLTRDSEHGFRCVMQMARDGGLGAEVGNANIALMGAQARIELVRRDGPGRTLLLSRRRSAGHASRYFDIVPGADATAADVALVGAALDTCFAEDPFQFAGLEESLAGAPPPGIGEAWRLGGWSGVVRAVDRRLAGLASREYTTAIILILALGFSASVLVLWGTQPRRMGCLPRSAGETQERVAPKDGRR